MQKKLKVYVICGGKSAEHEVSLRSAHSIVNALDKKKHTVAVIGIEKDGRWYLYHGWDFALHIEDPKRTCLNPEKREEAAIVPSGTGAKVVGLKHGVIFGKADVVFPVLHGPFGEDGTVQGLLKLADAPFVGPSVLGSAVGMDKEITKRILRDNKIAVAPFFVFCRTELKNIRYRKVKKNLGPVVFVKPANLGSSVGISKAKNEKEFKTAVKEAFKFDDKILIEKAIRGREIECSVLGNEKPIASHPGEIIPNDEFYSYAAKYINEDGATLNIQASLRKQEVKMVQDLAIRTYQSLCLEGMTRVDFFLTPNRKLIVNEVNTIPGFTVISLYPKMMESRGFKFPKLVGRLIELAIERWKREKKLETNIEM